MFLRRLHIQKRAMFIGMVLLGLALGGLTFGVLGGFLSHVIRPIFLYTLIIGDVIFFVVLSALIIRRIRQLWRQRKKADSRLHVRLLALFGTLTLVPTVIMLSFSIIFFRFGLQEWFSERVKSALERSRYVADAYLKEHQSSVGRDATLVSLTLQPYLKDLKKDSRQFSEHISRIIRERFLTEAIVFDENKSVIARSQFAFSMQFEPIPEAAIQGVSQGDVAILNSASKKKIRALLLLSPGLYLLVGRPVDPSILKEIDALEYTIDEYSFLENKRLGYEKIFVVLFSSVGILLLLLSIWVGLVVAEYIARPMGILIRVAERFGRHNLFSVRMPLRGMRDEFLPLAHAFNSMAHHVEGQQKRLLDMNERLAERHAFISSVLSATPSCIIGFVSDGCVTFHNKAAEKLVGKKFLGESLYNILPYFWEEAEKNHNLSVYKEKMRITINGNVRICNIRCVPISSKPLAGYVATVDDVTELIQAQQHATWSDVARRIAHEVKNPLTPIQLSAERALAKHVHDNKDLAHSLETIVKQVDVIENLLSSFSRFAQMPKPSLCPIDIKEICTNACTSHKHAYPSIDFSLQAEGEKFTVLGDKNQLLQVLTNILKNSAESMQRLGKSDKSVHIHITREQENICISIKDTGEGFIFEKGRSLFDPYVTTQGAGHGLGLAIVYRIIEEHGGQVHLRNDKKGAIVEIKLRQYHGV